jgi:hypothetical protein
MPQIDDTGKLAVSLYGKTTNPGDTALEVVSGGFHPSYEVITLKTASAVTVPVANAAGTVSTISGRYKRFIVLLNVTATLTDTNDTLDVFVDFSLDNSIWFNAVHFTQVLGDGGAKQFIAILDPSTPGTADVETTSDAAVHTVRPYVFGPYVRARWTVVDPDGTDDCSFTFAVSAFGQG